MDSLDEDEFWSSPTRRDYHSISCARVSKLNKDNEEIYCYDGKESSGELDIQSEDDYIDF